MKKTLAQNISRYDNKIRVRYNLRTLRILLVSAAVGIAAGLLLGTVLIGIYAIGLGALIALILFAVQIVEVDGIPLLTGLRLALFPPHFRQYEHTARSPEDRLSPDSYKERSLPNEKAKRKERAGKDKKAGSR